MANKTIYTKTGGRLGNQLFEIIGGYSIAKKYGYDYKVKYEYNPNSYPDRQSYNTFLNNIRRECGDDVFVASIPPCTYTIQDERSFELMPQSFFDGITSKHDTIQISHLLQSEEYLNRDLAHKILDPSQDTVKYITDKYGNLDNTVALSVRRGDYLYLRHIFVIPSEKWYMDVYEKFFKGKGVLISSDDLMWCMQVLRFPSGVKVQYVIENAETALSCMQMCKGGFIGSNSTFSWWGAYLGDDGKHDIVFPDTWFKPSYNKNNIVCHNWILEPLNGREV